MIIISFINTILEQNKNKNKNKMLEYIIILEHEEIIMLDTNIYMIKIKLSFASTI